VSVDRRACDASAAASIRIAPGCWRRPRRPPPLPSPPRDALVAWDARSQESAIGPPLTCCHAAAWSTDRMLGPPRHRESRRLARVPVVPSMARERHGSSGSAGPSP